MTDCTEARSLVEKLSDGEATAAERRAAESHLEECSSCRSHLEFLASLSREARSMSFPEPPESYWEHLPRRVLDRIDSESGRLSGFFRILFAPSMLRWGALGATLLVVMAVGVSVLREDSLTPAPAAPAAPPPGPAAEAPKAQSQVAPAARVAAEPGASPPMARDEAAPQRTKLESNAGSGEGERLASEAASPAAASADPAQSPSVLQEKEVTRAQDVPELRKENVRALESAYRQRAVAAPAALSRDVALLDCDELRRAVASMGDGPDGKDARYRLALCSLERHEREPTDELRKLAIEDAEAFLAGESEGPRAEEIRGKLDRIRPD